VVRMGVFDSALARRASDHLPIWADVTGLLR
jgi:endonuclease/exonuclease/phosphatase family metal-dependent hydrolase